MEGLFCPKLGCRAAWGAGRGRGLVGDFDFLEREVFEPGIAVGFGGPDAVFLV